MKSPRIRLLVTLVLSAAFASVVVGDALASRTTTRTRSPIRTVTATSIAKPTAQPTNGEPDGGQTITAPPAPTRTILPLGGWTWGGTATQPGSNWLQWIWAYAATRLSR